MARIRNEAAPISWLHVAGLIVVLWAVSSDSLAQARDVLVTDVRGTATRANAAPLRALDTLRVGERVRLSSDSQVDLFSASDAQLYVVGGPAEVAVTAQGVTANGKPVAKKAMSESYRNLRVSAPDLVQGSMVMRNAVEMRVTGPQGIVTAEAARQFSWSRGNGTWRLELATHAGDMIYRANVRDGAFTLPVDVNLAAGERYVWGILPAQGGATPLDWTEFTVAQSDSGPSEPGQNASPTDRVLYAAWLKSRGMERAALRAMSGATR